MADLVVDAGPVFDLIRFRHSVEHVVDPLAELAAAARGLAPGGTLLLELPNVGGWLARLAGAAYWQLDPPRHLVIPHRRVLVQAFEAAGLRSIATSTGSTGHGVATSWTMHRQRGRYGEPGVWYGMDPQRPRSQQIVRWLAHAPAVVGDWLRSGDNLRVIARR